MLIEVDYLLASEISIGFCLVILVFILILVNNLQNLRRTIIKPANGLHNVWKCIVDGNVRKEGTDARQWKLNTNWLDGLDTLYNREIYDEIIKSMEGKKAVLITGTPGVGKSTFLQRYLVHIVENCKTQNTEIPRIVLALREKGETKEYLLNANGTIEEFNISIHVSGAQVYLSDSIDSDTILGSQLHLEVASSKDTNYNQFTKKVRSQNNNGLKTNMDLFSFSELLSIRGDMSEDEAWFRYCIVGGSARNFLTTFPTNVQTLDFVEDVILRMAQDYDWHSKFPDTFAGYCKLISEQLQISSGAADYPVLNSLMRHLHKGTNIWASKCMEMIAAEVINREDVSTVAELRNILNNGSLGGLFEGLMHRKFTRFGYKCMVNPLYAPNQRKVNRNSIGVALGFPIVMVRTIEDIQYLENGKYGLPMFDNFPLVDAIIQPNMLLQMTVSPKNHKGAVLQLESIRSHLHEKDRSKHMMIFVVPYRNMKTFQYQTDLSSISQFITGDNETASVLY